MTDAEVMQPGLSLIQNDRLTKGVGLILYSQIDQICEIVVDSDSHFPASLGCRLQLKSRDTYTIALVHRPLTLHSKWTGALQLL